jgi:hypothetical protein
MTCKLKFHVYGNMSKRISFRLVILDLDSYNMDKSNLSEIQDCFSLRRLLEFCQFPPVGHISHMHFYILLRKYPNHFLYFTQNKEHFYHLRSELIEKMYPGTKINTFIDLNNFKIDQPSSENEK